MTKRILGLTVRLLPALALLPCMAQADTRALPTVVSNTVVNVITSASQLETSASSMSLRRSVFDVQGQAAPPLLMLCEWTEVSELRDIHIDVQSGTAVAETPDHTGVD